MLKNIILSISSLLISCGALAQQQVVNNYGNVRYIQDDITSFQTQRFLGPSIRGRLFSPPSFPSHLPNDSNSYSNIIYDLGGNANERLQANLSRPLSKSSAFFFSLDRQSYSGWMSSSFSRYTAVATEYDKSFKNGLEAVVYFDLFIDDREMNGGLRGDNYSFDVDGFSLLTSDVWYASAFNRSQALNAWLELSYPLVIKDSTKFEFGIKPVIARDNYKYRNASANSLYFNQFGLNFSEPSIDDSTNIFLNKNQLFIQYSRQIDSVKYWGLNAWYGLDLANYTSNNLATDFVNNRIGFSFDFQGQNLKSEIRAEYFLQGFNAGDVYSFINNTINLNKKAFEDSSAAWMKSIQLNINFIQYRAPLIYERYRSEVIENSRNWLPISELKTEAFYSLTKAQSQIKLGAQTSLLSNWVYFDDRLNTIQHTVPILLLKPSFSHQREGKVLQHRLGVAYQFHQRSKVYSLPDWVIDAYAGIRFPVLRRKIFMTGGLEGWFFSGYLARGYVPFLDVFYVQRDRRYEDYIQLNPVLTAKIQTVQVSLRYIHVNYGFTSQSPLVAPGFPSIPRYLSFQIDWKFKN